jgi:hypothetical protein
MQLEAELRVPRAYIRGAADRTESPAGGVGVGAPELRCIGNVEELEAELGSPAFSPFEGFGNVNVGMFGRVKVDVGDPTRSVTGLILSWGGESGRIEPTLRTPVGQVACLTLGRPSANCSKLKCNLSTGLLGTSRM